MNGARQAAEVNIRSLLPVEGQTVPEGILLNFFDRQLQQQEAGMGIETDLLAGAALDSHERSVLVQHADASQMPQDLLSNAQVSRHHTAMGAANCSKKRSYEAVGIHLDPAFEQAFKRQCQMPPTPPKPALRLFQQAR